MEGRSKITPSRVTVAEQPFDLIGYAKKHRYRLRNLHDGGPVPPARRKKSDTAKLGYVGASDRWDAIVGYNGYVTVDGDRLSVFASYRSVRGVSRAVARLTAMGGRVDQVGDTEVGATVPVEQIEGVLRLIKVSKLQPGDASRFRPRTEPALAPESHGRSQEDPCGPGNRKGAVT